MHLILASNHKTLATISIDATRYKDHGYLAAMQRLLKMKHRLTINTLQQEPVCYLQLPSKMHRRSAGHNRQKLK